MPRNAAKQLRLALGSDQPVERPVVQLPSEIERQVLEALADLLLSAVDVATDPREEQP